MDRPGKWNSLIAALAGLTVFIGYSLFPITAFTPEMSAHAAVVAGLRPAQEIFPGLWRLIAYLIPANAPAFALVGRIMAGLFGFFAYLAIRGAFSMLLRPSDYSAVWSNRIAPVIAFIATLMMAFADPVWRVFAIFAPASIVFLFVVIVTCLYEGWIVKGGWWRLVGCLFLTGLFIAETPLALVFPPLFGYGFVRLWADLSEGSYQPREDIPDLASLPIWRIFLSTVMGIGIGFGANVLYMISTDMSGACGWKASYLIFHYWEQYLNLVPSAATFAGWLLAVGLVILPFLIVLRLFPRLTDDDLPVNFGFGLLILLCGVITFFEQGPVRGTWFWTWIGETESVSSQTLLGFISILASSTVAFAGAIFAFDAFNEKRAQNYENGVSRFFKIAVVLSGVVALLTVIPELPHRNFRKVLAFNDSAVKEVVREANGATRIFTDGSSDAALELEANRIGKKLYAINLMGTGSDYDLKLRTRALDDEGDMLSAQMGAPVLLRVWACNKKGGLDNVAMQLGLELWKRERTLAAPQASAFLARTTGLQELDVSGAVQIAKSFADRIQELTPAAESADVPPSVRREFFTISWRLSRMARFRHDIALADKLETMNSALKKMLRDIEYERMRVFMQLSPSEGLDFALRRADFSEAARYGAAVLKTDSEDPSANFGMGMYFLQGGRLDEAEKYLRKVLIRRPREAASLNNLSIICRKSKRYEEALKFAKLALEIAPENEEIQKTHRDAVDKAE